MIQGIPNMPEVPPPVAPPSTGIAPSTAVPSTIPAQPALGGGPNAAPLNLFPQVIACLGKYFFMVLLVI